MPTEIKRAIRTADAWAADQAAMEALYGVGGYHTSISAFITWAQTNYPNLVTSDVQLTAVCYDDWPSGLNDKITISGITADATRYIKLTVAEGNRHNGTPRSGFYVWLKAGTQRVFDVSVGYCRFEWMDVYAMNNGSTACYYGASFAGGVQFDSCIGETVGGINTAYVFCFNATNPVNYRNCLSVGGRYGFTWLNYAYGQIYNCVATGAAELGYYSTATGGTIDARNCIAYNNATNYNAPRFAASSTNNASSASDAPGSNPINGITSAHFVDAANKDFHLLESSSLRDSGVNLYSSFTTDIDGDPRPSAGAWSVGYDQYIVETILPTLTDPTAAYITPTTATPRVTVTYP